tara:strand:+ start:20866 stop:22032 length:1167 start_codon:yes stop_codon:yes gene_type:complete
MKLVLSLILLKLSFAQACETSAIISEHNIEEIMSDVSAIYTASEFLNQRASISQFCDRANEWARQSEEAVVNNGRMTVLRTRRLGPRGSGHTQEAEVYYRGCRYDIEWMQSLRESLCLSGTARPSPDTDLFNQSNPPNNIVFLFDGAGGFEAEQAHRWYNAVNLDGSEGADWNFGHMMGMDAIWPSVEEVLGGEGYQLHYHNSSGFMRRENVDSASSCAKQMSEYIDIYNSLSSEQADTKWIALGFSNGGDRVLEIEDELGEIDRGFDLVFTIDPITQYGDFIFSGLTNTIGSRNERTGRFVNFYQQNDLGSHEVFGIELQLEGKPVRRADVNYLVTHENNPNLVPQGQNHTLIPFSPAVQYGLRCELEKLRDPDLNCNYAQNFMQEQ